MADPALAIAVPLIAGFESFRAAPYRDSGGTWTIGYGFTYLPDGSRVTAHTPRMTEPQAYSILTALTARTLAIVRGMVDKPISHNAAAALTSFAYNEGTGRLRASPIIMHVNMGDMVNAGRYFAGYVYVGGERSNGLANRRAMELALFNAPDGHATPGSTLHSPANPLNAPESDADRLNDAQLRK